MDTSAGGEPRFLGLGMIEARPSRIHGLGLFALQTFRPGDRLAEYRGERIDPRESLRREELGNEFLIRVDAGTALDGGVLGNLARWANHSCAPNAEMTLADGRLWLVARESIRAGTEITFDYGYDLTDWRSFPCQCGASQCAGFIVAEPFRPALRKLSLAAGLISASEKQD